jgi:hypothetical protein
MVNAYAANTLERRDTPICCQAETVTLDRMQPATHKRTKCDVNYMQNFDRSKYWGVSFLFS